MEACSAEHHLEGIKTLLYTRFVGGIAFTAGHGAGSHASGGRTATQDRTARAWPISASVVAIVTALILIYYLHVSLVLF